MISKKLLKQSAEMFCAKKAIHYTNKLVKEGDMKAFDHSMFWLKAALCFSTPETKRMMKEELDKFTMRRIEMKDNN